MPLPRTILCIASFFKGNTFLEECKRQGVGVVLVTREAVLHEPWCREHIDEVFAMPTFDDRDAFLRAISYLARTRHFDRVAALDEEDIDRVAMIREYLRIPGMGETTAHYFRDKLAMRARARDRGVRCPEFVHVLNHDDLRHFFRNVKGPWILKPRSLAGGVGIEVIRSEEEAFRKIESLGDSQPGFLFERMIPGDVYHIDGVIHDRKILMAEVHKYRKPVLDVVQSGGVFATRTIDRNSERAQELRAMLFDIVNHFGLVRGVTHTEVIHSREDGQLYFLETAARVGGGHISDLVEVSTGISMWREYAKIEIGQDEQPYALPDLEQHYAAVLVCLSKQDPPDLTGYTDPQIARRLLGRKQHVGFVLKASSSAEIEALLEDFSTRMERDFLVVLPPPSKRLF